MFYNDKGWRTHVDTELSDVGARLKGVESGLSGLTTAFNNFTQNIAESAKPPWGVIIAGFTVTVVIVTSIFAAFTSGYIRDINRVEQTATALQSQYNTHAADGHPKWINGRVDSLKEKVNQDIANLIIEVKRAREHDEIESNRNAEQETKINRNIADILSILKIKEYMEKQNDKSM
jgi:hypothetical protein